MIAPLLMLLAGGGVPAGRCAIQGWSVDTDPAGLRVHASPALAAREIGRLPPAVHGEDSYAPAFDIVDVRNGWLRIAHADDADNPGKRRPMFAGTG